MSIKITNQPSRRTLLLLLTFGMAFTLSGCGDSDESTTEELRDLIEDLALTGDPTTGRTLPSISDPKAQLGMKVFFTKNMSAAGDGPSGSGARQDAACVTCHHPILGGGDDLSLSIGVQAVTPDLLGPGRTHSTTLVGTDGGGEFDGGPTVPRNAPTTFNMALWDRALFHDGRVEALDPDAGDNGDSGGVRTPDSAFGVADASAGANLTEAQARFPVTSPEEMKGFQETISTGTNDNTNVRNNIAATMTADWATEFNTAFGDTAGVTYARIAEVIAEYERSQVFVDTPWKAFAEGDDDAMSKSAKRGAVLFFNDYDEGGANCASCHSGDFFTDEDFHVLAMPQVGRGKGDESGTGAGDNDFGRSRETGDDADKFAFRTPSLINVTETGPWTHAGAYTTLEAVVRHHLDPETAVNNYDTSQLEASVQASNVAANTSAAIANLSDKIEVVDLSDDDVSDLLAFLNALTDPCVTDRDCLADWIPDSGDTNPDGLRLNGVDQNSNPL